MARRNRGAVGLSTGLAGQPLRCAIYTRKSTEEGLEQSFNSLDAQREACAAYIASQRHEGWEADPAAYDDGGFSGGNMERPGLKRLLADVMSGRIHVIVVYKVDRLTRALSDFAKIVEVLDKHGASFVSVTQAFNTTTSMGRLTLNVLLSFAQFEREVTGERIRDKIAASKKKGMWMGGTVPLGYDARDRQLVINDAEAATVRMIFERYVELQSLPLLAEEIERKGMRSKVRALRDGRQTGGAIYSQGALAHILKNVIYIGRIPHGDNVYDGQHEAIVSPELWDCCQALLTGKRANLPRPRKSQPSPLNGFLEDEHGRGMMSAHANRGTRRYRYYVSRPGDHIEQAWRIPAGDIEAIVVERLKHFLGQPSLVVDQLGVDFDGFAALERRSAELMTQLGDATSLAAVLEQLRTRIIVSQTSVDIHFTRADLAALFGGTVDYDERIEISAAVTFKRRGHELRLIYAAPEARPALRDDHLIQLLAKGRRAWQTLKAGEGRGPDRRELVRMARLQFLAPDIIMAILEGRQPVDMTARSLLRVADLPLDWREQRRVLGFATSS